MFDAVCIIVLMEHTLLSCLFGCQPTPSVLFLSEREYLNVKEAIFYRLGLDPGICNDDFEGGDTKKQAHSPSPIRRLEE